MPSACTDASGAVPLPRSNGFGSAAPAESLAEWRLTSPKDAKSAWRLFFSKTSCKGCGAPRVPCYGVATAVQTMKICSQCVLYLRFSRIKMPILALKTFPSPNCTKVSELGIPLTRCEPRRRVQAHKREQVCDGHPAQAPHSAKVTTAGFQRGSACLPSLLPTLEHRDANTAQPISAS